MLRGWWLLNMAIAVVFGQAAYIRFNCSNKSAIACVVVLELQWVAVLVVAAVAFGGFQWTSHVWWTTLGFVATVSVALLTLLFNFCKWRYDLEKDHKQLKVWFSVACLDAAYLLVLEWLWWVEEGWMTLLLDCTWGPASLVCHARLGKWPSQLVEEAEQDMQGVGAV
jgi:membrane protein YdbS with pleckstrin-like domain